MKLRSVLPVCLTGIVLLTAGCSRNTINYQVAEAIGTVGMYSDNQPVETPRMKEVREQQEQQEQEETQLQEQLDEIQKLTMGCYFDEALEKLDELEKNEITTAAIEEAAAAVEEKKSSMTEWTGDIPHLCFPTLIYDTAMAFDGDTQSYTYSGTLITAAEFTGILESLYENDYILVDLHSVVAPETDDRGVTTMEMMDLEIPEGKKPIILSQDNLNYSDIQNGDGIATRLTLNQDGEVKAVYTDDGGHDLVGDYDFIPILDSFIDEHPDFALRNAKGIVSVSASEGVFGYQIQETAVSDNSDGKDAVQQIADALKADGWSIAYAGYSHAYMDQMSAEQIQEDLDQWMDSAGVLVGTPDILFYPYGAEVTYPSDQQQCLTDNGLLYLCGLWGDRDFMELDDDYVRQTRRFIDGYTLQNAASYFTEFFDAASILDSDR